MEKDEKEGDLFRRDDVESETTDWNSPAVNVRLALFIIIGVRGGPRVVDRQ